MFGEKTLLVLNYLGEKPDLEPKVLKKTLKEIGVDEVYLGRKEQNALHITCFAKWKDSQIDKKRQEIENKIPRMKVIQAERLKRI